MCRLELLKYSHRKRRQKKSSMKVTRVESVTKTKYKVFLDEQFAFELYKGELSRYRIAEGAEMSETLYDTIRQEVILKRVKLRALHLLNAADRTESDLRSKLRQNHYPEDIVEEAIAYVKRFGYINDDRYVQMYVLNRKEKKSRKEIYAALLQKGIPGERIDAAFEDCYDRDDALEAIQVLLSKKGYRPDMDEKQKQKIYGYLARKGFGYEEIRRAMEFSGGDDGSF